MDFPPKQSKSEFEADVLQCLEEYQVRWVVLAGFMRLLSAGFLKHYQNHVLNIHPSLLPACPGLHAQEQALEAGVRITGATVHLVDEGTDTGPIIVQGAVPVHPSDDLNTLKARILSVEHRYPMALRWAVEGHYGEQGCLRIDSDENQPPGSGTQARKRSTRIILGFSQVHQVAEFIDICDRYFQRGCARSSSMVWASILVTLIPVNLQVLPISASIPGCWYR